MVRWMLIGFVNISGSYSRNLTFVHSLVLALALHFYPPPVCNFCRRLMFHYCSVGFVIFSCQYFSPAALLHSSAQRSAFLSQYFCSQSLVGFVNRRAEFHIFQDLLAPKVLFTSPNPEITIHPSNPMAIPIQVIRLMGYLVIW